MKFLGSQMAAVKLRLLEKIFLTADSSPLTHSCSNHPLELHHLSVCHAVEDRICKKIDLATRTDLTDQQALEALRLLFKIVRQNNLTLDFSPGEFSLLTHGVSARPYWARAR
jgi:hypothetical protein